MVLDIAYACNNNFVQQTIISMMSLLENHRMYTVVLYLIEDRVQDSYIKMIKSLAEQYDRQLEIVSLDVLLKNLQCSLSLENDRHPYTIYAKLFLDQICNSDRILYLDSDTVVTGSLRQLWEMDMRNTYIAGVRMPYTYTEKKRLGLGREDIYVCDGVLLIHLKKWREDNFQKRCVDYIRNQKGRLPMLSEGVVNYIARRHVGVLHPRYNLMSGMILWTGSQLVQLYGTEDAYYSDQEIEDARNNPVIIHYLNELYIRPWFGNSDHPYKHEYLYYRAKAGYNDRLPFGSLKTRTGILRLLNALLPFTLFRSIYGLVKRRNEKLK